MIERTYGGDSFAAFLDSPLSIRAEARYAAYGESAKVFLQTTNGEPSALIADDYGDITLIPKGNSDYEELKSFLKFTGFHSVTLPAENAKELFEGYNEYPLMRRIFTESENDSAVRFLDSSADTALYRQIYALGGFTADFTDWYADMAARVCKQTASGALLFSDGELVGMALASFICPRGIFISAVAAKASYTGKGYASRCVRALCGKIQGEAYLWCEESLTAFYERLGFIKSGAVAVVEENI